MGLQDGLSGFFIISGCFFFDGGIWQSREGISGHEIEGYSSRIGVCPGSGYPGHCLEVWSDSVQAFRLMANVQPERGQTCLERSQRRLVFGGPKHVRWGPHEKVDR